MGRDLRESLWKRAEVLLSWIKFGNLSLCCLLEGVEACCRGVIVQGFVKSWEDGGRKFKLESRANEAGRFLLCSMVDSESKRYLVFPEEKGILGGWVLLAEKLRFLRVLTRDDPKVTASFYVTGSTDGEYEGKAKKSYVDVVKTKAKKLGEVVWLQLGEKDILSERELLDRCLVGRWGQSLVLAPNMPALKS